MRLNALVSAAALTLAATAHAQAVHSGTGKDDPPRPANILTLTGPLVNSAQYQAPADPKYDYVEVIHKSYLFFWAQRSGKMPYQRLAWRADSFVDAKGKYGEDLSGGWFEAANTMKWGGPFAFTAGQLAWTVIEFGDALKVVNEYEEAVAWVKHGAEFLLNTYTVDAATNTERLMGLFGDSARVGPNGTGSIDTDFGYFGPPEEYMQGVPGGAPPTAYYCEGSPTVNKGCTDIAGDYAAALASAAVVMRPTDAAFAEKCLSAAKTIFAFGQKYNGTYQSAVTHPEKGWANYREWYASNGAVDETALAATWLHIATGEAPYLATAQTALAKQDFPEYSWGDKSIAAAILVNRIAPSAGLGPAIKTFFTRWLPGGAVPRSPRGLAFNGLWGSLAYAGCTSAIALVHAKVLAANPAEAPFVKQLQTFAVQQVNYILGDAGKSFVVGFGTNPPLLPYHKSSYNSILSYPMRGQDQGAVGEDFLLSRTPNRHIAYGALVNGPEVTDQYVDNRENYVYTEVTQDYNAALTFATAGLIDYYSAAKFKPFSDCNLDLGWSHPNATQANKPKYSETDCYHTCAPCVKLANGTFVSSASPAAATGNGTASSSTPDASTSGLPVNTQDSKNSAATPAAGSANAGAVFVAAVGGAAALALAGL
ncbi:hypothetical protein HDU86_001319 [Geranomyces michiganensis]|nr:hypothetical protein HDU86_001319 [Geranomyces michiganensis]